MTAAYTTALAAGTALAAASTVPLVQAARADWRFGLGIWAALSAVAVVPWLLPLHGGSPVAAEPAPQGSDRMVRSSTAWALALYFGAQSMHAYITFGWFALFFREQAGFSAAEAGAVLAFITGLSIPVSLAVPSVAARLRSQRPLVLLHAVSYAVAYIGMAVAPRSGAWLWALLVGIGAGAFPLALTMIGLRTRTPEATAALSAFAQSVGYVVAAAGPLLVGFLHDRSGGWSGPLVLLLASLTLMLAAGWYAARPRYVEDELAHDAGSALRRRDPVAR
jgi:CP family cyanate transporter-like MFS transporter